MLTPREEHRRQMSEAFAAAHGSGVADIIMEHLPPEGWGDLVTKTDLATQGLLLRSDLETQAMKLRHEFGEKLSDLRDEVSEGFRDQRYWIIGTAFGFLALLAGVISATAVFIR